MQFDLTPAQRALQQRARELGQGPIFAREAEIDRAHVHDRRRHRADRLRAMIGSLLRED